MADLDQEEKRKMTYMLLLAVESALSKPPQRHNTDSDTPVIVSCKYRLQFVDVAKYEVISVNRLILKKVIV